MLDTMDEQSEPSPAAKMQSYSQALAAINSIPSRVNIGVRSATVTGEPVTSDNASAFPDIILDIASTDQNADTQEEIAHIEWTAEHPRLSINRQPSPASDTATRKLSQRGQAHYLQALLDFCKDIRAHHDGDPLPNPDGTWRLSSTWRNSQQGGFSKKQKEHLRRLEGYKHRERHLSLADLVLSEAYSILNATVSNCSERVKQMNRVQSKKPITLGLHLQFTKKTAEELRRLVNTNLSVLELSSIVPLSTGSERTWATYQAFKKDNSLTQMRCKQITEDLQRVEDAVSAYLDTSNTQGTPTHLIAWTKQVLDSM